MKPFVNTLVPSGTLISIPPNATLADIYAPSGCILVLVRSKVVPPKQQICHHE